MMLGRDTIPAKVIEQDSREATMLQYSENFHRQDLNPIQNARMLKFMLEELGYSTAELAKFCSRTKEWISRQLGLLDMNDYLQQAVEQGQISASVAMELKLIPDEKLRLDYTNYAITSGCTEKAARSWATQAKAVVAAREARQQQAPDKTSLEVEQPSGPPEPRRCSICGAPEDKVLIEDWPICWHCGQKLKPQHP
jgi:ParB-like chromosome segregation protein Spo0J